MIDIFHRLFAGEGTIYLITGFFTATAYNMLRDDIIAFLERDPDNELVVLVSPAADQISTKVIHDLQKLESSGQIRLRSYPDRFLHAKLYIRDGPEPLAILGSPNLTKVAFEYNLELAFVVEGDGPDDPAIARLVAWAEEFVDACDAVRARDTFTPIRVGHSIRHWSNKARLLPARHVVSRLTPIIILIVLAMVLTHVL